MTSGFVNDYVATWPMSVAMDYIAIIFGMRVRRKPFHANMKSEKQTRKKQCFKNDNFIRISMTKMIQFVWKWFHLWCSSAHSYTKGNYVKHWNKNLLNSNQTM